MSLLRKISKNFLGFFFTVSLILTITIFGLISFTQHDTISKVMGEVLKQSLPDGTDLPTGLESIKEQCEGQELLQIVTEFEDITINCSDLNVIEEGADMQDFFSSAFVDSIYYKEYNCEFLDCLKEETVPLLITEFANKFYTQILIYFIIATIIFGVLFVLAVEGIKDKLKSVGFSLLWVSVPFIIITFFVGNIISLFFPPEIVSGTQVALEKFIDPTFNIYIYMLIVGIALVVSGYLVKRNLPKAFKKK